jgi:hypothetical protein
MGTKIVVTVLLAVAAVAGNGCGSVVEAETQSVEQLAEVGEVSEALTSVYYQSGSLLFQPFTLTQNCTLSVETAGATLARDPVLGLIINNGNSSAWGASAIPCKRGTPGATDGYSTLAFGDDVSASNYNAKLSYKNNNGGAAITVFAVGFIKEQSNTASTSYGTLPVAYRVTGCNDPTKNTSGTIQQNFQGSGKKATLPGYVFSVEPRPGGPGTQPDTVLYTLDPNVNGANGKCNDDCAYGPAAGSYQSCIPNNSGAALWYFSAPWFSTGFTSVNN